MNDFKLDWGVPDTPLDINVGTEQKPFDLGFSSDTAVDTSVANTLDTLTTPAAATEGGGTFELLFGGKNDSGLVSKGLNAAGSLLSGYASLQQYGLAKDQFKFNRKLGEANFGNQLALVEQDAFNKALEAYGSRSAARQYVKDIGLRSLDGK